MTNMTSIGSTDAITVINHTDQNKVSKYTTLASAKRGTESKDIKGLLRNAFIANITRW